MSKQFPFSDHCNGRQFRNLGSLDYGHRKTLKDVLKWKLGPASTPWPLEKVSDIACPDLSDNSNDQIKITFINHATLLIQYQGINVLTDPVFSEKLGPYSFLNLKRYRDVGLSLDKLPKIHVVFVSHNHFDHLDLPSCKNLDSRDRPDYIVPLGVGQYLPIEFQSRITELDWWQSVSTGQLRTTLVPAHHWSRRTARDTNQSLWAGAVFEADQKSVYFAGDTGFAAHFEQIRVRFPKIDVALLPIGAYEPRWFMKESHMNPEEAVLAHLALAASSSLAIHFGTFRLTDEGIETPVQDLNLALEKHSVDQVRFRAPKNGETFTF